MNRIFSQDELEEIAIDLMPEGLRDRVSLYMCAEIQVRPLTRTPEGRTAIVRRLERIRAVRGILGERP
jgi:hypothetical protein